MTPSRPPCLSHTPTTSSRVDPSRMRFPIGLPSGNNLSAMSAPMTATLSDFRSSSGDMPRPSATSHPCIASYPSEPPITRMFLRLRSLYETWLNPRSTLYEKRHASGTARRTTSTSRIVRYGLRACRRRCSWLSDPVWTWLRLTTEKVLIPKMAPAKSS